VLNKGHAVGEAVLYEELEPPSRKANRHQFFLRRPPHRNPGSFSSRSRRLTSLLPVPADTPCLKGRPSVLPFSV